MNKNKSFLDMQSMISSPDKKSSLKVTLEDPVKVTDSAEDQEEQERKEKERAAKEIADKLAAEKAAIEA